MTVSPQDTNSITGAPHIFGGKVIIGFGGADLGPARGYVSTYDAETGKLLWRWHTVPGNPADGFENEAMRMAADTWAGEWWKDGGGGTVWNAMSYDPETDTVFIGTGNGSPWNHKARSQGRGDNLFLASIVALDGTSGRYKWHYQVNPGESWDYNATMDLALAEIEIGGRQRKVLMTAPKNGFFYVIDLLTGKLISAEPYAKVNWASKMISRRGGQWRIRRRAIRTGPPSFSGQVLSAHTLGSQWPIARAQASPTSPSSRRRRAGPTRGSKTASGGVTRHH